MTGEVTQERMLEAFHWFVSNQSNWEIIVGFLDAQAQFGLSPFLAAGDNPTLAAIYEGRQRQQAALIEMSRNALAWAKEQGKESPRDTYKPPVKRATKKAARKRARTKKS